MCVSEPTANDCDIDAGGHKMDSRCVSKRMGSDVFAGQRWNLLRCGFDVLIQFEANSRRPQRLSVAIDEDLLVVQTRLPFQQGFKQVNGFRPKRAGALFSPLS